MGLARRSWGNRHFGGLDKMLHLLFDRFVKTTPVFITWGLLRLFFIEVSREEVRKRQYNIDRKPLTALPSLNPGVLLQFARDLYALQDDRAKLLFEKSKNLLTVSALMVA